MGDKTKQAIAAFQKDNGMDADRRDRREAGAQAAREEIDAVSVAEAASGRPR